MQKRTVVLAPPLAGLLKRLDEAGPKDNSGLQSGNSLMSPLSGLRTGT